MSGVKQFDETTVHAMRLRAQATGRLAPSRDIRALARFVVVAVSRAPALTHRSLGDLAYARDVAAVALTVFDAPPPALSPSAAAADRGSGATPDA